jgi:hypothetical protein
LQIVLEIEPVEAGESNIKYEASRGFGPLEI